MPGLIQVWWRNLHGAFRIGKMVGQGNPLSPKLFTAAVENVLKELNIALSEIGLKMNV